MTAGPEWTGGAPAVPRPGIVRTLGVLNIVFAVLLGGYALWSALLTLSLVMAKTPGEGTAAPTTKGESALSAFTGPAMIRFGVVDLATAFPLQILMFASGVGLLNLRRGGATWWARGCWAKIVRLVGVWGYFLFGVVPPLSAGMANSVVAMIRSQQGASARVPPLEQITLIYSVMLSVFGGSIIVLGVLYPAVSLWLLGRPGVKSALSPSSSPPSDLEPATEPNPP